MRPVTIFFLLLLPCSLIAQSLPQRLDSLMHKYHRNGHYDGTVLVAAKGKVVYSRQFGFANRQFSVPAAADTRFPLASITKLFTAVLVLQMQEAGKIKLDDPIGQYLPDILPVAGRQITIRQLLVHCSGLMGDKIPDYYAKSIPSPVAFMRKQVRDTLVFTPGSKFNYNNIDYILLGALIERVAGKPWGQVLKDRILGPLQLEHTGVIRKEVIIPRLASGYHNYSFGTGKADDSLFNDEDPYFENYATAGGMYATANDLFIITEALYTGKLLGPEAFAVLHTPMQTLGFVKYARGYPAPGIYINALKGKGGKEVAVWERRGSINGFNTALLRVPEQQYTIILLCNTDSGNMSQISDAVLQLLDL